MGTIWLNSTSHLFATLPNKCARLDINQLGITQNYHRYYCMKVDTF